MKYFWKWIERIVTAWGFLSILAIFLDVLGVLPLYDVVYKRKTDIEPVISLYPGQNVRLSANFASAVSPSDIESVKWVLKDSSGHEYGDLPSLKDVDFILVPDFSGTVSARVSAKLLGDQSERYGYGAFHIVQKEPIKLFYADSSAFIVPSLDSTALDGRVQVYSGNDSWVDVTPTTLENGSIQLLSSGKNIPVWGGTAYLRVLLDGGLNGSQKEYEYLAALPVDEHEQRRQ